jgi:hypothetical protein
MNPIEEIREIFKQLNCKNSKEEDAEHVRKLLEIIDETNEENDRDNVLSGFG